MLNDNDITNPLHQDNLSELDLSQSSVKPLYKNIAFYVILFLFLFSYYLFIKITDFPAIIIILFITLIFFLIFYLFERKKGIITSILTYIIISSFLWSVLFSTFGLIYLLSSGESLRSATVILTDYSQYSSMLWFINIVMLILSLIIGYFLFKFNKKNHYFSFIYPSFFLLYYSLYLYSNLISKSEISAMYSYHPTQIPLFPLLLLILTTILFILYSIKNYSFYKDKKYSFTKIFFAFMVSSFFSMIILLLAVIQTISNLHNPPFLEIFLYFAILLFIFIGSFYLITPFILELLFKDNYDTEFFKFKNKFLRIFNIFDIYKKRLYLKFILIFILSFVISYFIVSAYYLNLVSSYSPSLTNTANQTTQFIRTMLTTNIYYSNLYKLNPNHNETGTYHFERINNLTFFNQVHFEKRTKLIFNYDCRDIFFCSHNITITNESRINTTFLLSKYPQLKTYNHVEMLSQQLIDNSSIITLYFNNLTLNQLYSLFKKYMNSATKHSPYINNYTKQLLEANQKSITIFYNYENYTNKPYVEKLFSLKTYLHKVLDLMRDYFNEKMIFPGYFFFFEYKNPPLYYTQITECLKQHNNSNIVLEKKIKDIENRTTNLINMLKYYGKLNIKREQNSGLNFSSLFSLSNVVNLSFGNRGWLQEINSQLVPREIIKQTYYNMFPMSIHEYDIQLIKNFSLTKKAQTSVDKYIKLKDDFCHILDYAESVQMDINEQNNTRNITILNHLVKIAKVRNICKNYLFYYKNETAEMKCYQKYNDLC